MDTLVTIGYIAICVLLFSLAICIHEFGHFIVAIKLGLNVERFSLGFGPALWKRTWRGVEYRISAIPLGGYVAIPDVDPEGTKAIEGGEGKRKGEGEGRVEKTPIPAWKEIAVAVAGPGTNLVLAVFLACLLAVIPGVRFGEVPAVIGDVIEDGPAARAGMQPGDRVVAVGGHAVRTWTEMQTEVQIAGGEEVDFSVIRGDAAEPNAVLHVTPEANAATGAYYIMALSVTNAVGAAQWMPTRNPIGQLVWDAGSIFRVLKGLVTPKEAKATGRALGGPVMIAQVLYYQIRRDVWDGIGFLRFLNVNLAVLNLLPIPVLDGGLILFSLFALVFRRRIPEKVVGAVSMAFMVLLVMLMLFLFYRDGVRTYRMHREAGNDAVRAP